MPDCGCRNLFSEQFGAAYVTETGSEIGAFRNNIAIRSTGSCAGIESRQDRQDFGHRGDGFWFQGAGIEVEGNIAAGQRHSGFVYFTRGLIEPGLGTTQFLAHNLAGNFTDVSLKIVVDPNAARQADKGFLNLPAKTASATLMALLLLDDE